MVVLLFIFLSLFIRSGSSNLVFLFYTYPSICILETHSKILLIKWYWNISLKQAYNSKIQLILLGQGHVSLPEKSIFYIMYNNGPEPPISKSSDLCFLCMKSLIFKSRMLYMISMPSSTKVCLQASNQNCSVYFY